MDTITVMPNQSLQDVVIQACGSMEAGMQFCKDNGISISDYPDVGTIYNISKEAIALGDTGVSQYLAEKGLVLGTLGAIPPLGFTIVLKPLMTVVPTDPNPPNVSGFYSFKLKAAPGFININPIAPGDYPSFNNMVSYETEDRVIADIAPAAITRNAAALVMGDKMIPYRIPWVAGRGFMMIWSDLGVAAKTTTFTDIAGNQAYISPLIVLDNSTQATEEYLVADLQVELVSATRNTVQLRLKRTHTAVVHADFVTQHLSWLHDAAGGTADPLDVHNPDITIVTLPAGTYTFGVGTVYVNGTFSYPPSAFSMVVTVG